MAFVISHRFGGMDPTPPLTALDSLLDEVLAAGEDDEHGSVYVKHDSEWAITVDAELTLMLENVEDEDIEPRELSGLKRVEVLELLTLLARGDIESVQQANWR